MYSALQKKKETKNKDVGKMLHAALPAFYFINISLCDVHLAVKKSSFVGL